MASRAELRTICKELEINDDDKTIDEMKELIRQEVDKRWGDRKYKISADSLSDTLKRFITKEYDYKVYDKEHNEVEF